MVIIFEDIIMLPSFSFSIPSGISGAAYKVKSAFSGLKSTAKFFGLGKRSFHKPRSGRKPFNRKW